MNIIGTGLSGLVGSRVVELLSPSFQFQNLSLHTGIDITNKAVVDRYIDDSDSPWVFHFAAKTDVDEAERERAQKEKSQTWMVNVSATEHIVEACKRTKKRLLYISTDFVFDGTKDSYTEEDTPRPLSFYAITKYEGEKRVLALGEYGLVVRISFPYRTERGQRPDFVHKIIDRLVGGQDVVAVTDQIFVPTYIDDIAYAIQTLIQHNAFGVYHAVGGEAISPFTAAQKIASALGFDASLIKPTSFAKYFAGRAPRPFHAHLKNGKITKLGIVMRSFSEVVPRVNAS